MTLPINKEVADAYRKKLSESAKGRVFTEEHKQKLRDSKLKKPTRYWLGKKRIAYSRKGMKEWIRKNKPAYNLQEWKDANKLRRTLELEKIAGRKKPKSCEVCGSEGRICFDHDHKTGAFRGWICEQCNVILGFSKDTKERLVLLARYLDQFHS